MNSQLIRANAESIDCDPMEDLLEWNYANSVLDRCVVQAVGLSGDPRAGGAISKWIANWPKDEDSDLRDDLVDAYCRLDEQALIKSIPEYPTGCAAELLLLPTPGLFRAFTRAEKLGDRYAPIFLCRWDRGYRRRKLEEIAKNKEISRDRASGVLLKFGSADEVLRILCPVATDLDKVACARLLGAFLNWSPSTWDGSFLDLLRVAPGPDPEQLYEETEPWALLSDCESLADRQIGLLATIAEAPFPPDIWAPIIAVERLLFLTGGEMPRPTPDLRDRVRRIVWEMIPEKSWSGRSQVLCRVMRWVNWKGKPFPRRDFELLMMAEDGPSFSDLIEPALTLASCLDESEALKIVDKVWGRLDAETGVDSGLLFQETKSETVAWWLARLLVFAVSRPDRLAEIPFSHHNIGEPLFEALAWNQMVGLSPNLEDRLSYVREDERQEICRKVVERIVGLTHSNPFARPSMRPAAALKRLLKTIPPELAVLEVLSAPTLSIDDAMDLFGSCDPGGFEMNVFMFSRRVVESGLAAVMVSSGKPHLGALGKACLVKELGLARTGYGRLIPTPHAPTVECRPKGSYQEIFLRSKTLRRATCSHIDMTGYS